jgi:ABC-type glycerol-3-phosphate transport system substrate-binding protein
MKNTLTTAQAAHLLVDDANANWSRAGAFALVEYLEEIEESTGDSIGFDVVAIRCDFSEHANLIEWASEYCGDDWKGEVGIDGDADEEDVDDAIREYLTNRGTLIEFNGGIIVSSF